MIWSHLIAKFLVFVLESIFLIFVDPDLTKTTATVLSLCKMSSENLGSFGRSKQNSFSEIFTLWLFCKETVDLFASF